ncbi:ATP-binding protein [Falsihalocynthiibacter sp. SS001]|uniref:ATP-binding protein n=1 Tax=Falsihalocynthiibacter sp. SS001 TaxID=3349698 RepID=UPI0036D37E5B
MPDLQSAALLAGIPHAVVLIDAAQTVAVVNPLAQDIFGKGLVGRHYITALRQPVLLDCVENCINTKAESRARFIKGASTHETVFEVVCRPVAIQDGGGMLLSFQDITPFEVAGQMRRDFVANVSHELRTPLTALAGFIETLRGPAKDDSQARDRFLGIMEREAARMNRLVRDLLSLSRVESEERIRPDTRQDIIAIIETAIVSLRPQAVTANVHIIFEPPKDAIYLSGDADQLQQVFSNLIENAIKYGAHDADVVVKIEKMARDPRLSRPSVRVSITDQGEGIDPLHIPRLTERFYRVDGHRSREMGGTGLGLAIVKHIINRHRGRLQIESKTGQGSTFTVILPLP